MLNRFAIMLLLLLQLQSNLYSQCITPPPLDSCNGTETALTDNEILNSGTKKWYYGPTAVFNQLTIKGGVLVVCSDLTIDKFYMDSGTIVIRPGARFVVGGGIGAGLVLGGNCRIYNYGDFESQRNLSLENNYAATAGANVFINAIPASVFKMPNQYFVINNPYSFFVNKGQADFHGLITDPGAAAGSVCLGNGSETRMTVLYNKSKNSYIAPAGTACVSVSEYSQFYDTLTASPSINVCLNPKHYSDSSYKPWGCKPNAWGKASIFKNCNTCMEIQLLSVYIRAFSISNRQGGYELDWETDNAVNQDMVFRIERSADGNQYNLIDSVTTKESTRASHFNSMDNHPLEGYAYYRIQCINKAGTIMSSSIQKIFSRAEELSSIYPNPFTNSFTVSLVSSKKPIRIEMLTITGLSVYTKTVSWPATSSLNVTPPSYMPRADYLLKIIYEKETVIKKIKRAY